MKWLGILLLLGASTLTGCLLASRLDERVRALRAIRKLIGRFSGELAGRRISTGQMLREAAAAPEFALLGFLGPAAKAFDGRAPFYEVWEKALAGSRLPPSERELLLETGRIIGASDRESQLAALSLLAARADSLTEELAARAAAEGKLCRSLGVLAGLFFAVLAI